mmetsp:Transcript_35481/g.90648  ORF Transcript_35481/g.90648 Transcript_35481/m.90648 type:complete len:231 (+) Transcript_35481:252-944(+)
MARLHRQGLDQQDRPRKGGRARGPGLEQGQGGGDGVVQDPLDGLARRPSGRAGSAPDSLWPQGQDQHGDQARVQDAGGGGEGQERGGEAKPQARGRPGHPAQRGAAPEGSYARRRRRPTARARSRGPQAPALRPQGHCLARPKQVPRRRFPHCRSLCRRAGANAPLARCPRGLRADGPLARPGAPLQGRGGARGRVPPARTEPCDRGVRRGRGSPPRRRGRRDCSRQGRP